MLNISVTDEIVIYRFLDRLDGFINDVERMDIFDGIMIDTLYERGKHELFTDI